MRQFLGSRIYQISFVSASLLFVFWLGVSMWVDAFEQRRQARSVQHNSELEVQLIALAEAIAAERRLAYTLFSAEENSRAAIGRLQTLADNVQQLAQQFDAGQESHQSHAQSTTRHDNMMSDGQAMTHQPTAMQAAEIHDAGHRAKGHHHAVTLPTSPSNVGDIIQYLEIETQTLYQQIDLPRNQRDPGLGMSAFHVYSSAIDAVNDLRRVLYAEIGSGKQEFFVHSKLTDTIWNLRESVKQIASLIEAITEMTDTSAAMAQTRHHADMLMELNIRVDLAWTELLKISTVAGARALETLSASSTAWYSEQFKSLSFGLAASSRFNEVSLAELRQWLVVSDQMRTLVNQIQEDSNAHSLGSFKKVENSASINLALVSVMVAATLAMAIASVRYFRRVQKQANIDDLTGLDNRRMFYTNLKAQLTARSSTDSALWLLMIDLDRFKYVNDTMGHAAGDNLLQEIALRIGQVNQGCRSFARLGGDEFAILFADCSSDHVHAVAESIRDKLKSPFSIGGAVVTIGSSIGIAHYPEDGDTPDALIKAADLAMYCAKRSGTNVILEYNKELDQSMLHTATLLNELQLAVQEDQFLLHYQPQFNLGLSKVVSVEALIRWNHPVRGLVPPNDFIPVAEQNGLLPIIGDWVLNEACRQAAYWLHNKNLRLRIAVNISSDHFFQADFVQKTLDTLEKHNLPPQLLELEVTEGVAVNDISQVVESLARLRESSIHVALDDFGTGYSSLSYLQELPLDTLKIDKSFIQKMCMGNEQHDSITEAIVAMGQSLNLETVAEGVETENQLSVVSDLRISIVQGYYYSKPVCAEELEDVITTINSGNGLQKAA